MKTVIVGAGVIGTYIAELLTLKENDITVIDTDKTRLKEIEERLDVKAVHGNAVNLPFLKQLEVHKANLFISTTNDDAINLISALSAKNLGVNKTIARVRNKEFIEGRKITNNDFFGIDLVFCPEDVSANEIAKRVCTPGITAIEFFAEDKVLMREFNITANSPYLKLPLKNLNFGDSILIGAIFRKDSVIIPTGDDSFQVGDRIFIIGDETSITEVASSFGEPEIDRKNLMIFGGGNIGYTLCRILEDKNFNIKLVEPDQSKCDFLSSDLNNVLVLNASALDTRFLLSEDISGIDTFIAVTDNEEDNLISSIMAKTNGAKETVAVVNRIEYVPIAKMLGIDTIVNPKTVTASTILSFLMSERMKTVTVLSDERAKIIEIEIKETCSIIDVPLSKAKLPADTIIGAISRNNRIIIPNVNESLQIGDIIMIITLEESISRIAEIFY